MIPLKNKILLDVVEIKMGAIETDTIGEIATVIRLGADVDKTTFQVGQKLAIKSWAIDIITDPEDNKKYYFISADLDAICGIK